MTTQPETIRRIVTVQVTLEEVKELEHLRARVTDLQASNSALEERARAAERSARDAGGAAPSVALAVIAELSKQRDEARAALTVSKRELAASQGACDAFARVVVHAQRACSWDMGKELVTEAVDRVVRERDELKKQIANLCSNREGDSLDMARMTSELDEAKGALHETLDRLQAMRVERDGVTVPPELARLYRAAQKARVKWSAPMQRIKAGEECGEYIAELMRNGDRYSAGRVAAELHDVLTVCALAVRSRADEG